MSAIYLAILETENFTFKAFDDSESKAKKSLIASLKIHAKQFSIPESWYLDYLDSINIEKMHSGIGYRDYQALTIFGKGK